MYFLFPFNFSFHQSHGLSLIFGFPPIKKQISLTIQSYPPAYLIWLGKKSGNAQVRHVVFIPHPPRTIPLSAAKPRSLNRIHPKDKHHKTLS